MHTHSTEEVRELTELQIDKISLVDDPAMPSAQFMLFKRRDVDATPNTPDWSYVAKTLDRQSDRLDTMMADQARRGDPGAWLRLRESQGRRRADAEALTVTELEALIKQRSLEYAAEDDSCGPIALAKAQVDFLVTPEGKALYERLESRRRVPVTRVRKDERSVFTLRAEALAEESQDERVAEISKAFEQSYGKNDGRSEELYNAYEEAASERTFASRDAYLERLIECETDPLIKALVATENVTYTEACGKVGVLLPAEDDALNVAKEQVRKGVPLAEIEKRSKARSDYIEAATDKALQAVQRIAKSNNPDVEVTTVSQELLKRRSVEFSFGDGDLVRISNGQEPLK